MTFVTRLTRYAANQYVKPYVGEYVVREVNSVYGYKYQLKVKDSGCRNPPQTWREMVLAAMMANVSHDDVWNRNAS